MSKHSRWVASNDTGCLPLALWPDSSHSRFKSCRACIGAHYPAHAHLFSRDQLQNKQRRVETFGLSSRNVWHNFTSRNEKNRHHSQVATTAKKRYNIIAIYNEVLAFIEQNSQRRSLLRQSRPTRTRRSYLPRVEKVCPVFLQEENSGPHRCPHLGQLYDC